LAPVALGTPGDPGIITIETFGTQPLPTNFNLTSTTQSEFALPGGLFNVGNATVNGSAASIVAGEFSATSQNAGNVLTNFDAGTGQLTITVTGNSFNVTGVTGPITSGATGTTRNKVTPGVALALFQVTRNTALDAQTIGLNLQGQVTDTNPQTSASPSVLTIAATDLYRSFTTFNLATSVANQVELVVNLASSGPTNALMDLSVASLINIAGRINFAEPESSTIAFGSKAPFIAQTGRIFTHADGILTLTSTNSTWTLNGIIEADQITLRNPSGGTNLMMSSSAQLIGFDGDSQLFLSAVKNFNIVNATPNLTPPLINNLRISAAAASIQIGSIPKSGPAAPILLGSGATFLTMAAGNGTLGIVAVGNIVTQALEIAPGFFTFANMTGATGVSIQTTGNIEFDELASVRTSMTSTKATISMAAANVIFADNVTVDSSAAMTINATQQITQTGDGNLFISDNGTILIIGQQGVSLESDFFFTNQDIHVTGLAGTIDLSNSQFTSLASNATLGSYKPAKGAQFTFAGDLIVGGDFTTKTGMTMDADSVTIEDDSTVYNTLGSGSINIISRTGDVLIGDGAELQAGMLFPAPPPGVLATNNIQFKGSVNITAQGAFNLGHSGLIQSVGGDVKVATNTGDINLDNSVPNGEIRADGGNIVFAAAGDILNNDNDSFIFFARAVGTSKSFTGGGISLVAGSSNIVQASTDLVNALKTRPATFLSVPDPFTGFGVTLNAGTRGVARATFGTVDSIDMAINGSNSGFNVNGGVITLTTTAGGAVIEMDNVNATALAPIAFHQKNNSMNAESGAELVVDTGDDFSSEDEVQDMALAK
jgi:hypothetical protein